MTTTTAASAADKGRLKDQLVALTGTIQDLFRLKDQIATLNGSMQAFVAVQVCELHGSVIEGVLLRSARTMFYTR